MNTKETLSRIMEQVQMNSEALNLMSQEFFQMMKEQQLKMSYYKCNKCRDTGWILIDKKDTASLAISCECGEMEKLKNQWKAAGINPEKSKQTFVNFEIWNECSRKAKDAAIVYFKDFDSM